MALLQPSMTQMGTAGQVHWVQANCINHWDMGAPYARSLIIKVTDMHHITIKPVSFDNDYIHQLDWHSAEHIPPTRRKRSTLSHPKSKIKLPAI